MRDGYYHYPHLIDEDTKTEKLNVLSKVSKFVNNGSRISIKSVCPRLQALKPNALPKNGKHSGVTPRTLLCMGSQGSTLSGGDTSAET